MPRSALAVGTYGKISTKKQANGSWRASTRYRDQDGETRTVSAFGPTAAQAITNLKKALLDRGQPHGEGITRETKLSELADLWLEDLRFQDGVTQHTIDIYYDEINVSTDKRAKKETVKIKTSLGGLRIREATTSRLDRHIKDIGNAGKREKARRHRVILTGMMSLAVRHGACATNPVREVSKISRKRTKPRAADLAALKALREQLRAWQRGEAIEGTPAYTHGPKRSQAVLDIADIMIATGTRPGEALAIRWCDIDLAACPPRLAITGTVVRITVEETGSNTTKTKGAKHTKLIRQEWPKTDAGRRTVALPRFAVDVLMRLKVDAAPNDYDVVFATRAGGLIEPNNFNRSWRSARGSVFDWVTPKTFRKTVVTMIADEHGPEAAASQAGHSSDTVTRQFYWDKGTDAPDFTEVLDRIGQ